MSPCIIYISRANNKGTFLTQWEGWVTLAAQCDVTGFKIPSFYPKTLEEILRRELIMLCSSESNFAQVFVTGLNNCEEPNEDLRGPVRAVDYLHW